MKYYMKFGIEEIENLIPIERDILLSLFTDIKEKEKADQDEKYK